MYKLIFEVIERLYDLGMLFRGLFFFFFRLNIV